MLTSKESPYVTIISRWLVSGNAGSTILKKDPTGAAAIGYLGHGSCVEVSVDER